MTHLVEIVWSNSRSRRPGTNVQLVWKPQSSWKVVLLPELAR